MVFNWISICSFLEVFFTESVIRHSVGVDFEEVDNAVDHNEKNSGRR